MTGPRDYFLRVVVEDLADYERFIKETLTRIAGIANIESSFALTQVKHTNVLPVAKEQRIVRRSRRASSRPR